LVSGAPNAIVEPIDPKAKPVILTDATCGCAPRLRRRGRNVPAGQSLKILAGGEAKEDEGGM